MPARLLAALVLAMVVLAVPAAAAHSAPHVTLRVAAPSPADGRPTVTLGVRDAPRGACVLLQQRVAGRWVTRARTRVRGDRTVRRRAPASRARGALVLRAVLVDRRGRTLDTSRVRRVPPRAMSPIPTPPATPEPPAPAPAPVADPEPDPSPVPPPVPPAPAPAGPLVLAADALRLHSLGADRWDVWTCGAVGTATAADAAAVLEAEIVPFYGWLSGGRYRPEFRARGALVATDLPGCETEASAASAGRDGAVILQTERISAGADACLSDPVTLDPCAGEPTTLPGNERLAWLSPETLLGPDPRLSTAVHELGHALTWPHSHTGRLHVDYMGTSIGVEYDDPFDVMGYERLWGTGAWTDPDLGTFTPKAVQAFSRIAVGWMPDAAIAMHERSGAAYDVGPLDGAGVQAVIVPTADPRAFLTLEARVPRPYDPVPGEGVVVHAVDQRPSACDLDEQVPGCFGESVRQSPAPNTPDSLDSLVTVGESVDVAGVRITVTGRAGDRFAVVVDGARAAFALKPTVCLFDPTGCGGTGQGPL